MKQLIFILLILPNLIFTQSVKGKFSPAKNFSHAFLYKSTPEGANYINRGELDSIGRFEIPLDSTVVAGIYKIVYAVPAEKNNFDFIYDGKETVAFNFSYEKGIEFTESEENKLWSSYLKSMDMVNQTISNYYAKNKIDKDGFQSIFKVLNDTQSGYEELAKDKLVSTFIKANKPYIPVEYEDLISFSKHLKQHYLTQIDFSNYLLQSSSFLVDRITIYVFNISQNPNDTTYKKHIDDVASAISDNHLVIKTNLLEVLWKRFGELGNHTLANYIADSYLLELAHKSKNIALAHTLISYKNTSIGAKAPDFDIIIKEKLNTVNTTLHQLKASENYLLIFWSSSCGHCLNELPKVKELIAKIPNLRVIAFGLEESNTKWAKEIKSYPNFTHVIGLGKWENEIVKTYGIEATPSYFILNKDKIIVSKPYLLEELETTLKEL